MLRAGGPWLLARRQERPGAGGTSFDKIAEPTPAQRRAFELIKAPIPLNLTLK